MCYCAKLRSRLTLQHKIVIIKKIEHMKTLVLNLALLFLGFVAFSQSVTLEIPIVKTGQAEIEIEDDNDVVIDTITIDMSSDDAEQVADEMDSLLDDDIDAGWDGEDFEVKAAGLRFQNLMIPQGAVIESAYIEFTSHEAKAAEDVALLKIYAEASDNAETFTMDALITDRALTTAMVDWTVAEAWGLWTPHQSPDVKTIVQELVDRDGWAEGNAIAFVFNGSDEQGASEMDHAREWEAFENISDPEDGGDGVNHPERVPKLFVTYNSTVGVVDQAIASQSFKIYPNPAGESVNINLFDAGVAKVTFYNALGMVVMNETLSEISTSINTTSLSKGIYHVVVDQNTSICTQRLVIE